MTRISVDVRSLAQGAGRARDLGTRSDEHARAVGSVLQRLDMNIRATEHFDRRLKSTGAHVATQARELRRQADFLTRASTDYERAERSVLALSRDFAARHPAESMAAGFSRGVRRFFSDPTKWLSLVWRTITSYPKYALKFVKLDVVDDLIRNMGWSSSVFTWAMKYGKALKAAGWLIAVMDGVGEYVGSAGSVARRVSNAVVVGGAKYLAGSAGFVVGAKTGAAIGLAVGTVLPGPGHVIGFVAGLVLGAAAGYVASEAAGWAVNQEIGGRSVKDRIGDVVDATVARCRDLAATGAAVAKEALRVPVVLPNVVAGGAMAAFLPTR